MFGKEKQVKEDKEDMAKTDKEFIDFIMRERMQLNYARMRENQEVEMEDEEDLETEQKCKEVLSRLAKEDLMCIELYYEAMVRNFARENEFYYRTGIKDGYMLRAYLEKHMGNVA